jgi:chemotaxis family two-component system sensor kinase Cph1
MAEKNYDSEFCGNVPLHNVNLIQDYGYLIVLDKATLDVVQVSENLEQLLNKPVQEVVNTPISAYIEKGQLADLTNKLNVGIKDKIPLAFSFAGQAMLALAHTKPEYIILELQKAGDDTNRYFTDVFQEIKYTMAAIDNATSVKEVSEIAVREVKRVAGFDGVMMYRFDKDWNGTVIAEEKEDGLEAYIGHTFPASDIPRQARQMYYKNPYRLIPNREYQPIRLYPVINPVTHSFIDLFDCNLRSVAAVHIEYLKNMNVMASMSIRVTHNEELWGLMACHHITPRYLSFEICSVLELLSSVISNKISSIINKEEFDLLAHIQNQRGTITEHVYADNDIATGILKEGNDNLLKMFGATGAAVVLDGKHETMGQTPDTDSVENLVYWLQGKNINKVFSTNHLADLYEDAGKYADIASGMLVIPIDAAKGDYILCFRPEVVRTINWGGDPNEAINFESDGKKYHPRYSFKLWKQIVEQTSLPWLQHELNAADSFRSFIFEFKTKQIFS